jgi:FkbM family methyltransferase
VTTTQAPASNNKEKEKEKDLAQLENILRQIEAEPRDTARMRESGEFDKLAAPLGGKLILFGAGPLGKGILAGLRQAGVEPVAFADNDRNLWQQQVMGLPVLSPAEAAEQHGKTACFVVTIYQGSLARRQLEDLGCQRVVPWAPLAWKYAGVFIPQCGLELPHRFVEQFDAIRQCHPTLADELSRRDLREQLLWRYWLDFSALSPALDPVDTYFPKDLLAPAPDEVFVDCGSFDGDSIRSFNNHWAGKFQHAFAFEPDPSNRAALVSNMEKMGIADRVTVMPYAVGNINGKVSFACNSSASSHITTGDAASTIDCRRLDDIEWPYAPTYIKMDIEGAEPEALAGGAELLRRHQPVLAVCTYHRNEHLWDIPNLIHSISPDYHIFSRRYAEECWEGVCYAIPQHRLKRA